MTKISDERAGISCWLGEPALWKGKEGSPAERSRARGAELLWTGDLPGALSAFDEAGRLDPKDPWTPLSRAAVRFKGGDLEGARADAAAFRRLRPSSAAGTAVDAMLAAASGDKTGALAFADRSCELSGGASWTRALRGALRGRWGDLDGAREDLDAALLEEKAPWALAARADALNRLGFFWLALEDLDRLRALMPGDPEPDAIAIAIHRDQAQYADALRRIKRVESVDRRNPRWPRLRSEVLFVQGKVGAAARELKRALALAPTDQSLLYEHIRVLALAGRERDAARALKAASLPRPVRDHLNGYLCARRRDWKKAEALFKAAALFPGPDADALRERASMYAMVAREMQGVKPIARLTTREMRLMGLGYRQPFQVSVQALAFLAGAEIIYSNLSDTSVVDFVGLFGVPFQAIVFRRSDHEAFKCALDVMPGFKKARIVGVVTRGHPLYYGRLAYRLSNLVKRRGYAMRVPGSASLSDTFLSLSDRPAGGAYGAQIRDCNDMTDLDTRLPLVLYNFAATGDWRAELPKRLMATYPAAQPVALLAGSGDREFSPLDLTLGTMEAALRRADEAVTILIPAVAS